VIGSDNPRSLEVLNRLYRPHINQTFTRPASCPGPTTSARCRLVPPTSPRAELIKYAANAFLALKISYVNEIGQLPARSAPTSPRWLAASGSQPADRLAVLQPGVGWGGSASQGHGGAHRDRRGVQLRDADRARRARSINQRQRANRGGAAADELAHPQGRKIGLLGVAFKPNTDDLRDSPALDIARLLLARGARVSCTTRSAGDRFRHEQPELAPHLSET